jgi:hypothetical protein
MSVPIVHVGNSSDADLMQIAGADGAPAPLTSLIQCREQHRRQNGNDGNYDEKFDESKCITTCHGGASFFVLTRFGRRRGP